MNTAAIWSAIEEQGFSYTRQIAEILAIEHGVSLITAYRAITQAIYRGTVEARKPLLMKIHHIDIASAKRWMRGYRPVLKEKETR